MTEYKTVASLSERIEQADSIIASILADLRDKKNEMALYAAYHELKKLRRDIRQLEKTERDWSKVSTDLRIIARDTA